MTLLLKMGLTFSVHRFENDDSNQDNRAKGNGRLCNQAHITQGGERRNRTR